MKIVDINEVRKNKLKLNNKNKEKSEYKKNEEAKDSSLDDFDILKNTAYFYSIDSMEVRFGGAYVRDLIKNVDKNKEKILKTIEVSNDRSKYQLAKILDKEDERYKLLLKALNKQEELMDEIIENLTSPQALDEMFQEGSKYLTIIGFVLTIVMVHSYSQLDYYRMQRDRWIELSVPIDDFINSQLYNEIKESGNEID